MCADCLVDMNVGSTMCNGLIMRNCTLSVFAFCTALSASASSGYAVPPPAPPSDKPAAPPAASPAAAVAAPKPALLPKERAAQYNLHLRAGQNKEANQNLLEAITEFEAALKVIPGDPIALSELGWAWFQVGDLAKAKKVNAQALTASVSPQQRAAVLYNMGRVAESEQDTKAATGLYRQSIAARPSTVVEARLADLAKPAPPTQEVRPAKKPRSVEDICKSLIQDASQHSASEEPKETSSWSCQLVTEARTAGAGLIEFHRPGGFDFGWREYIVVASIGKGWVELGWFSEEVGYKHHEELTAEWSRFTQQRLGSAQILWAEFSRKRDYAKIETGNSDAAGSVILCVLSGAPGAPYCHRGLPLWVSRASYRSDCQEDASGKVTCKNERSSSSTLEYKIELSADGTATHILTKSTSSGPEHIAPAATGLLRLWAKP